MPVALAEPARFEAQLEPVGTYAKVLANVAECAPTSIFEASASTNASTDLWDLPVLEDEVIDVDENEVLATPERDLRIETWPKRGKNGKVNRYWQWCERGASTGKQGGKRWRAYGGAFSTIPEALKKKHYRKGRQAERSRRA